jgi:hypothetical protein
MHFNVQIDNGDERLSYKCSCSNKLTMLMKLAIEKTDMDREVSFRMASRGCVRWYRKVNVYIIIRTWERRARGLAYHYTRDADPCWQQKSWIFRSTGKVQNPRCYIGVN